MQESYRTQNQCTKICLHFYTLITNDHFWKGFGIQVPVTTTSLVPCGGWGQQTGSGVAGGQSSLLCTHFSCLTCGLGCSLWKATQPQGPDHFSCKWSNSIITPIETCPASTCRHYPGPVLRTENREGDWSLASSLLAGQLHNKSLFFSQRLAPYIGFCELLAASPCLLTKISISVWVPGNLLGSVCS